MTGLPTTSPTSTPTTPLLRGMSHRSAFTAALTLAPIMIVIAPGVWPRFVTALYSLSIVALFGVSALYHRINWGPKARLTMQRLDHVTIFVAIAATYTPVAIFALSPWAMKVVLPTVWGGAALGTAIRLRYIDAPTPLVALPYLVVGWSLLPVVVDAWQNLGVTGFLLLLIGGLLYTVGGIVFALHRPDPWPNTFGFHEIFHVLTVAAAALHYVAITFIVLPKAA
ncbi:MAG: hemolysin III [Dehalococcoidia bacterium]|nr:hemolysin III [Dehalococcoidia bacterium]MDP7258402.1 hemolysin III family protein [Acidimicrobiales bacterium]HCV37066.1 hemolysin III [Acidimicrobiaceae bacterium]HJO79273.1 hemolysin III family protein [Acidimicrobiales bacterium]